MANEQKITEIISESAFEQLAKLQAGLEASIAKYAEFGSQIISLNKEVGGAKTIKEYTKAVDDQSKAEQKSLIEKAKVIEAQNRLDAAVEKQIAIALRKEKAEQRAAAAEKHRADALIRMSVDTTVSKENEYDANMKVATSEENLANSKKNNEAASISASKANKDVISDSEKIAAAKKAEEDATADLGVVMAELISTGVKLRKELKVYQDELKGLGDDAAEGDIIRVNGAIERQKVLISQNTVEIKRAAKENVAAASSSDALSARLDLLRSQWRALTDEQRDNTEAGKELEKEINDLDKTLKDLDSRIGVTTRNVGNYKSATEDLTNALTSQFPILNKLKTEFEGYKNLMTASIGAIKAYVTGTTAATQSTTQLSAATRIFRLALISTGIGAIVVVLGALVAYLTSTAEGMDRVTAVTRPLQAVFTALWGIVQKVGAALFDAFTNPKKAMQDIVDFTINEIIPVMKDAFNVLWGIATMDFSRAKSGLDGLWKTTKDVSQGIGDFFSDAYKTGVEIDKVMKDIRNSELELIKTQGKLNRTIREQGEIARDESKSASVRAAAAKAGLSAINQLTEQQISIQQKKVDLIKLENKSTMDSYDSQKQLAEAEAELDNIRADAAQKRASMTTTLNRANRNAETAAQRAAREAERQANIQKSLTEREFELKQQLHKYEEDAASRSADRYKRIADDERKSQLDRFDALHSYLDKRRLAITESYEAEAAGISKRLAEATKLEEIGRTEEAEKIRAIVKSQLENLAEDEKAVREQLQEDITESTLNILRKGIDRETTERINAINQQAQEEEQALTDAYLKKEISEREFNERRIKLNDDTAAKLIQSEIDQVQAIIDANRSKGIILVDEQAKLDALKTRLAKQSTDVQISEGKKLLDREKEFAKQKIDLAKEVAAAAFNISSSIIEKDMERLEIEKKNIDDLNNAEKDSIQQSTLNEEQKAARLFALESKAAEQTRVFEEKKAQLRIKQAKMEKAQNILSIIGNTAVSIMRAFADLGPIAGIPFAAILGATGAVQLASVIAQPLPQYYTGTNSSKEGFAHVGERGTELMIEPNGNMLLTPPSDTVTYLKKGTKILNHENTKRAIAKKSLRGFENRPNVNIDFAKFIDRSERNTDRIVKAVSKQKNRGTFITKSGWSKTQADNDKFNDYLRKNGM